MKPDLPPITWQPVEFIPHGDATVLPEDYGHELFERAVAEFEQRAMTEAAS